MFLKAKKKQMAQNFWHCSKRFSRDFSKWPKPNRSNQGRFNVDMRCFLVFSIYRFSCVFLSQFIISLCQTEHFKTLGLTVDLQNSIKRFKQPIILVKKFQYKIWNNKAASKLHFTNTNESLDFSCFYTSRNEMKISKIYYKKIIH